MLVQNPGGGHLRKTGRERPTAVPVDVARSFFAHAYRVGLRNLPDRHSAVEFTRNQMDRWGLGTDLVGIPWVTKVVKLPLSRLKVKFGY